MKPSATLWRHLPMLLLFLLLTGSARAQEWTIFNHETVAADTTFWFDKVLTGVAARPDPNNGGPYMDVLQWTTDAQKGAAAMMVDWRLFASEGWGGNLALVHYDSTRFYDFSDFTHIGLYFKNLVTPAEQTLMRLKLHDGSGATPDAPRPTTVSQGEDWYAESASVYNAIQNTWTPVSFPLENLGNNGCCTADGYRRPGWSGVEGNNELDLSKIFGFSLEWVTATLGTPDQTVEGTVVWDNLHVRGERYNVVEGFDGMVARDGASEFVRWGTGSSSLVFTDVAAENAIEGNGAVEVAWTVNASESWGGGANWEFKKAAGTHFDDMTARTHLSLFYNVTEAASAAGRVGLRVVLLENSEGQTEEWVFQTEGLFDQTTGGWTRLLMPLVGMEGGDPSAAGFVIPPWIGYKGNNKLDTDKIFGYRIEWTVPGSGSGTTTSGKVRFDRLTGYGFKETDFTAPGMVTALSATSGTFANTVSWTDVDGETGETYDVYYSTVPITDLSAAGVLVAAQRVAEGTGVFVHELYTPLTDKEVKYYYAVVARDAVGNVNMTEFAATPTAVTNTGKGVGTIALTAPASFAADGQLGEWSGVTPIHIAPGATFGYVPSSTGLVTDAADLSADVYVAAGTDALYVAFDVTDDRVTPVPAGTTDERWMWDGTELYIGFFDSKGAKSAAYKTATTSDEAHYKFQFYTEVINQDQTGKGVVATAGDGNYTFTVKPDGKGYVIEARLPYSTILFEGAPAFQPQQGWMVPFDVVVMDNDSNVKSREGILTFSPFNNDNSWQTPMNWFWAYTGTEMRAVSNEGDEAMGNTYALAQSFPNPFSGTALIQYALKQPEKVSLDVYNVLGQRVATLVDKMQGAGTYEVSFDAANLPAGIYIYRIQAGSFTESRSMTLVR